MTELGCRRADELPERPNDQQRRARTLEGLASLA